MVVEGRKPRWPTRAQTSLGPANLCRGIHPASKATRCIAIIHEMALWTGCGSQGVVPEHGVTVVRNIGIPNGGHPRSFITPRGVLMCLRGQVEEP